ncbi:hypothetical protein Efla_001610 [Eimeria flavescens]
MGAHQQGEALVHLPPVDSVHQGNGESMSASRPRWTHRPPSKRSFLSASFAVCLLPLTLAFLLRGCFLHLSRGPNVNNSLRKLATGGFNQHGCQLDGEESRKATDARPAGEDATKWPRHGGRRYKGCSEGWGLRIMPPAWEEKALIDLRRLERLPTKCMLLFESLVPNESVTLVLHVVSLGVVELSGFGYVPYTLQPVRQEVGDAFCSLLAKVCVTFPVREAAIGAGLLKTFKDLHTLVKKVAEVPPADESMSPRQFMLKFTKQHKLCSCAMDHLENHLRWLLTGSQGIPKPADQVGIVLKVVAGLAKTRKKQILRDRMFRRWLGFCHSGIVSRNLLYTRTEYDRGSAEFQLPEEAQLVELDAVVEQQGGLARPGGPLTTQANPRETTTGDPRQVASQPDSHAAVAKQQHYPGVFEGPKQAEPQDIESPTSTEAPINVFTLSLELAQELQREEALAAMHVKRRGTHTLATKAVSAEALGWGPGQMPSVMVRQMLTLMSRLAKVAITCGLLADRLNPSEFTAVVVSAVKLATMEMASLAQIPHHIQSSRARIAYFFLDLLRRVQNKKATRQAAARLQLEGTLIDLQTLLELVSQLPDDPEVLTASEYLVQIVDTWRLSHLSVRKLNSLVSSLLEGTNADAAEQVDFVAASIMALFETRKMQLLANPRARRWLCSCHEKKTPGLLFTRLELEQATHSEKQSTTQQLAQLAKVTDTVSRSSLSEEAPDRHPAGSYAPSPQAKKNPSHVSALPHRLQATAEHKPAAFARPNPRIKNMQLHPSVPPSSLTPARLPEIHMEDPPQQYGPAFPVTVPTAPCESQIPAMPLSSSFQGFIQLPAHEGYSHRQPFTPPQSNHFSEALMLAPLYDQNHFRLSFVRQPPYVSSEAPFGRLGPGTIAFGPPKEVAAHLEIGEGGDDVMGLTGRLYSWRAFEEQVLFRIFWAFADVKPHRLFRAGMQALQSVASPPGRVDI